MWNRFVYVYKTVRQYGVRSTSWRIWYETKCKLGLLKRKTPKTRWEDIRLEDIVSDSNILENYLAYRNALDVQFFTDGNFTGYKNLFFIDNDTLILEANGLLEGKLRYFFKQQAKVGSPPNWFRNPFTNQMSFPDKHWTEILDFDPQQGDIKFIWEPSRFYWAYLLLRAYALTGDEKYPELFRDWLTDWMIKNQPNCGPNFKCGQECAIRVIAVIWELYAFSKSSIMTETFAKEILKFIYVHGKRISANIDYARWQKNNHALSEALGLYYIGTLFPEIKEAEHWKELGRKVLIEEAYRQIYDDGSYIQHSMNYHRVMLHCYILAVRLAELNGDTAYGVIKNRLLKAVEFLYQLQDDCGRVPNYGPNDGALIFPMSSCDYLDYRAVIQAGFLLFGNKKVFQIGKWDEDIYWLFGPDKVHLPVEKMQRMSMSFYVGGYYTIRSKNSWAMMRVHKYKDRPSQADMLHVDLWYAGRNILRDSGTYLYYSLNNEHSYFVSSKAHNCITINDKEHMEKGQRFIWLDWADAEILQTYHSDKFSFIVGKLNNFRKLKGSPIWIRSLIHISSPNIWMIVDDIIGHQNITYKIKQYWQLPDNANVSEAKKTICIPIANAKEDIYLNFEEFISFRYYKGGTSPEFVGWESLYYGSKSPIYTVCVEDVRKVPTRFVTTLSYNVPFCTIKNELNIITIYSDIYGRQMLSVDKDYRWQVV